MCTLKPNMVFSFPAMFLKLTSSWSCWLTEPVTVGQRVGRETAIRGRFLGEVDGDGAERGRRGQGLERDTGQRCDPWRREDGQLTAGGQGRVGERQSGVVYTVRAVSELLQQTVI